MRVVRGMKLSGFQKERSGWYIGEAMGTTDVLNSIGWLTMLPADQLLPKPPKLTPWAGADPASASPITTASPLPARIMPLPPRPGSGVPVDEVRVTRGGGG